MKAIFLFIIGSLILSVGGLQAQQTDTEGTARRDRDRQRQMQSEQREHQRMQREQERKHRDKSQTQDAYANDGMVIIDKNEIPDALKETLERERYEGWEHGTIYHNTQTGEYVIAPRAYRFDRNGKEIDPNDDRQPTDTYRRETDQVGAGTQTEPGRSGREQYITDDMVEVQSEQVPEPLRRTLKDSQYEGWEDTGTLYQDPSTQEFVLVMDKQGTPRIYRFDRDGKLQE